MMPFEKVKFLCIFLSTIVFHTACQDGKNVPEGDIVVSLDKASVLENIKEVYRFTLDENCSSFPGMIHKMHCLNDTIYLLDIQKAPGLYVYDKEGKQLYAYDCMGEGPKEFKGLIDFQVNESSVFLFDNVGRKILELDKAGKFLSSESVPEQAYSFAYEPNGRYYLDLGNSTSFNKSKLLSGKDGNFDHLLTVPDAIENITISPTNTLAYNCGSIFYLPALEDKIHVCQDGKIVNTINLDFGKHWPDESFWYENKGQHPLMLFMSMEKSSYIRELNFLIDGDVIYLHFMQGDSFFMFFYHLRSGKQHLYVDKDKSFYAPCTLSGDKLYVMKEDDIVSVYQLDLETMHLTSVL